MRDLMKFIIKITYLVNITRINWIVRKMSRVKAALRRGSKHDLHIRSAYLLQCHCTAVVAVENNYLTWSQILT